MMSGRLRYRPPKTIASKSRDIVDVKAQVAVIGGGLTGITAGILLPAKVPGIQLTIFDKNADFVCLIVYLGLWPLTGAVGRNLV